MTLIEANIKANAADAAWQAELKKLYGKRAGDMRYTEAGEGEPGSDLRAAFNARRAAMLEWVRVRRPRLEAA